MLTPEQRLRPHPDVVDTELGTDAVALLHLRTKLYFSLNATGASIWRGLKNGLTLGEIVHSLQAEFEVESERAERSVAQLVDELVRQDLVERSDR